jgi:hypothetical protein
LLLAIRIMLCSYTLAKQRIYIYIYIYIILLWHVAATHVSRRMLSVVQDLKLHIATQLGLRRVIQITVKWIVDSVKIRIIQCLCILSSTTRTLPYCISVLPLRHINTLYVILTLLFTLWFLGWLYSLSDFVLNFVIANRLLWSPNYLAVWWRGNVPDFW